jgi:Ca2+-binding RTX toxin-like protein
VIKRIRGPKPIAKSRTAWSVVLVVLVVVVAVSAGYAVANASAEPRPPVRAVLSVSLTNNVAPPAPVITKAPPDLTYETSAHFEFADQGWSGSFQCRLDNGPFGPCSPAGISYVDLRLGRHCFYVQAVQGEYRSAPRVLCWRCRPIKVSGGFTIGGNAADPFYPGTSEPLDLIITNPFKFAIKVLSVLVTVEPIPAKNGVPDRACPAAANLLVTRPLGTTLVVPAVSTKSLSELGVPQAQWPVLTMPDLPTNQDACEGATFTLAYSGNATMGTAAAVRTTTTLASSPDPSNFGQLVTLTATVTGAFPSTGTVKFYLCSSATCASTTSLGTEPLGGDGKAVISTLALAVGTDYVQAAYLGGPGFTASTSGTVDQLVRPVKITTSTALMSSPDPSALGNAVTLTALVTKSSGPGTPTGPVSFYSGTPSGPHTLLGTASLNGLARATWSTSGLGASTHSMYAVYTGDTNFAGSSSPLVSQLVIAPPASCSGTFQNSIIASPADPTINGTNLGDFIYAFGGDYRINGFNGNDCIWVGDGDNVITDGNGNDVVLAGNGSNAVALGNGNDRVTLGTGPSNAVTLGAGVATVTVTGSGNHDTINGGNGNETIYFGTGTYNTYRGGADRSNTCHVPPPPSSWHGTSAAYYHDTLTGCTVVTS